MKYKELRKAAQRSLDRLEIKHDLLCKLCDDQLEAAAKEVLSKSRDFDDFDTQFEPYLDSYCEQREKIHDHYAQKRLEFLESEIEEGS